MTKKFKILFLNALLVIILSGCTIGFNTGADTSSIDGGIFKSLNKGTNWSQKVSFQTVGAKRSFASIDIISLALDPQDNKAIYASSIGNGLFFSYDAGESWQIAATLGKITPTNVAVDPTDKCLIYATYGNKVYKSVDCSRSWAAVYFDNDLTATITALVVDNSDRNNVFIGTSRGEIIRSSDRGVSWQTLNRFKSRVDKIIISPANMKIMFAGVYAKGIFRSNDAGLNWTDLSDKLTNLAGGRPFRDLTIVQADKPTMFLATNTGLAKSTDNGDTWTNLELIIEKARISINAIAINPFDANEIYYATNTTFYRSLDGGINWSSNKLPTNRAGVKLLIDSKNPSIIYLAVRQIKK